MANIAIFRINYKSDFILTLNSDAGWATPFCIKFWTGAPSQAYFVGFDGTTYTHCAPVDGEPTKLLVQFDDHHLPIGDLKFQIAYHFTVDDFPTSMEDEVINQASVIIEVDGEPAQVMLDLNGETAPEIQFSLPAYANEAQRIANEQARIAAEQQRIANEEARIAAETVRQQNEEQRIQHEEERVSDFARLKRESEAATTDANTAATLANEEAALAADKATLAQAAATLADEKAALAADKAALAQAAATLANEKAALAQQKAAYAQAQGDYANAQGDYAKEQGDYANEQGDYAKEQGTIAEEDHVRAESDHTRAESDHATAANDHTQAASDHTRAEVDHSTASTDHTTATNDHTQAVTDHATATSDHTQAGNDHTRAESDHTRAESDHAAVEVYVDSLGAFDISAYHATGGVLAKYADLTAALGTNGANIPDTLRKGGISVKFVQSSDNKYIQYRLTTDEWSIDTEDWAIADEGVYVENPEFVYIKTDNEDKILYGVKTDGNFYFGADCPQQVKDYIEEIISSLSLDEYEDIVAFLNGLEEGDKTLQTLLNEKVDKEEGKSLIDAEYASTKSTIDNSEFLDVTLDAEDKVLEGIQTDGTKVISGDIKVLGSMEVSGVSYKVIENPEYLAAWLDAEEKVIFGLKTDGKTYVGDADFLNDLENIKTFIQNITDKDIDWDALSSITTAENPEFIEVKTDSEGKLLAGRTSDGVAFEKVGFSTPKASIDGHIIENIEDQEGRREITTDSDGRIISYRDSEGVKHEEVGINSAVVKTNSLKLSDEGMNDFQQALKDAGFQPGGGGDWSDRKNIELPEPKRYALINIAVGALPINDEDVSEGYIQYYDGLGNYFKMECSLEVQGQSSRIFAATGGKGNYTLDLPKDIKFGSWVPQDSFHLKGCANDVTVAILPTAYKLAYILMERLDAKPNRVLKKNSEDTTINHATGDRFTDWPDDARCLPDGFPAEIYINGSYWGLYSLQLKKHRKNYTMDKKDYTSFFLDADGGMPDLFLGNIHWNQFEIKNPKDLICMDGSKYDGDHPKELIDNTSQYYDSSNKAHKGSKQTKDIIKSFSTKYLEVKSYIDNSDLVTAKEKFNEYFDYNACMLVYIYNCTMRNGDSVEKNTLWATWKNGKIAPMLWDLSALYGYRWIGNKVSHAPSASFWTGLYATASWPLGLFWALYSEEIKATYRTLREENIISIETWLDVVVGHVKRVGTEAYKRDIAKWSEVPNYRENFTNTEYWEEGDFYNNLPYDEWDENHNYSTGDVVKIRAHELSDFYMTYTAKKPSIGVCPVTQFYEGFPVVGGFYDGVYRMQKWLEEQLHLCDVAMGYSE